MVNKNYIILAYDNPCQLSRLVKRLDDGFSFFYIHVDKRLDISQFESLKLSNKVVLIKDRLSCIWGDFSLVGAILNCMQQIITDNKCNYTILLSEKCYPIVDNDALNNYLKKNQEYEHINIFPVEEVWRNWRERVYNYKIKLSSKKGDYIVLPYIFGSSITGTLKKIGALAIKSCQRKNFRIVLEVKKIFKKRESSLIAHYGGSLWWGLTYNTLRQVVAFTHNNNRYVTFHEDTLVPDEIFFHSIIKHLALTDKKMKIKPSLTYVTWSSKEEPHPITFTSNDLEELVSQRANNKMFARKFDAEYCEEILDLLDNYIMHNSSLKPLKNQVLVEQKPT